MSEAFRHSSQDILTYFCREVNGLKDSKAETRKLSLKTLFESITKEPRLKACDIKIDIQQELLEELSKPLLKLFSDEKEQSRELAIRLISHLVEGCTDATALLDYILPVLVDRLGAYDLEGIQGLPEQLKPIPSQKPQVLLQPPEKSEEVRVKIAELMLALTEKAEARVLGGFLDECTNIVRALVMDPASGEVIQTGCRAMQVLCQKTTEKLLHYSEALGRALLTSLVHKHWKVRKAGLEALQQVMYCGVYKYNANIVEALIGFRDPNLVPIKDFYEPSTRLNYFAMLVNDKSAHVRGVFFSVVANFLGKLPDKYDHESRLIPYLLSGLFDPIPEIKEDCFRYIEELGQIYEEEKEKEIREIRQLGYQDPWTFDGLMSDLPLPDPFVKRPRLGSRLFFRQYVRRYLNAIFYELGDWISTSRLYSSNLLLSLIIFTEDYITQHLEKFLTCMSKALMINNSSEILKNLELSTRLVGRYVDTNSYMPQILSAIRGELQEERDQSFEGAFKVLKLLLEGVSEALPPGQGLSRLSKHLSPLIASLQQVLPSLGPSQCVYVIQILQFLQILQYRKEELEDLTEIARFSNEIVKMCLQAEAFANTEATDASIPVIKAIFTISARDVQIFAEILEEIKEEKVENWHNYDENVRNMQWKEFSVLVKKIFTLKIEDERLLGESILIMNRIITSKSAESIHPQCIQLCSLQFPTLKVLESVINPALQQNNLQMKTRLEALKVISGLKITSLITIPGLCKCLQFKEPTLIERSLEEIHNQLEANRVTESVIGELVIDNQDSCSVIAAHLIEFFDHTNEDVRLLAIKVLMDLFECLDTDYLNVPDKIDVGYGKIFINKYVAAEFEVKLIGDIRALVRKLVALILAETEGNFKEFVHQALKVIKEKRPLAIAHECIEAKKGGFLKRWEYLDTLLSIPN